MTCEDRSTIQRARECLKCRYNLYGLAREGSCPECGHAYKRRKDDGVPKNPRRQLPPLRRLLRKSERAFRLYPLTWLVFAVAYFALYSLHAPLKWWILIGVATAVNGLIHCGVAHQVRYFRQKIEAVDQCAGPEQGRANQAQEK